MIYGEISLERMVRAVELVRERLLRVTAALNQASVPYAVVGGNAVAAWVSRVDRAAVRNTQDVDILIRRTDLEAATQAITAAGFVYHNSFGVDMFLDGEGASARDAVHIVFAGEKVRPEYSESAPDIAEAEMGEPFRVLSLQSLVRMKLTSFRLKDRVHLLDMLSVGLIDASWVQQLPPELAARLQDVLDHPDA